MFQFKLPPKPDQNEEIDVGSPRAAIPQTQGAARSPGALHEAGAVHPKPMLRAAPLRSLRPVHREKEAAFKPKVPVITGEVTYRGTLAVEGVISGQLGTSGGLLSVKQRTRNVISDYQAELNGELHFKDMLRVNGHIAGKVLSESGTLIVDASAQVDADVDVAIAMILGTVNGDIVAHQRVELSHTARINGNIWTRSLAVKPGAIFEGVCQMLKDGEIE